MDKRLILEVIPGPAFLIGNAVGGIFAGAGLAALATGLAVLLRWRWDRRLPLMALSILGLTLLLLGAGLALQDATWIKISNTVGSLAFAAIIAVGAMARPSLLVRTLGHSLHLTPKGWQMMHIAWIGIALARAAANELVWRNTSDRIWALYNGLSDIGWIGVSVLITYLTARRFWDVDH